VWAPRLIGASGRVLPRAGKAGTGASDPVLGASSHHLTARALRIDHWDQAADVEFGGHVDEYL